MDLIGIVAVVGAVLLGAALLFAIFNNKKMSEAEKMRSERAAKKLHEEIDKEEKGR